MNADPLCHFFVPGIPKPKGSFRPVLSKTTGRTFNKPSNPDADCWQARVAAEAHRAWPGAPIADAVEVTLGFVLLRPKSVKPSKRPRPTVYPDLDKLERTVLDALAGVVITDDALVCRLLSEKFYNDGGLHCGVHVAVTYADRNGAPQCT